MNWWLLSPLWLHKSLMSMCFSPLKFQTDVLGRLQRFCAHGVSSGHGYKSHNSWFITFYQSTWTHICAPTSPPGLFSQLPVVASAETYSVFVWVRERKRGGIHSKSPLPGFVLVTCTIIRGNYLFRLIKYLCLVSQSSTGWWPVDRNWSWVWWVAAAGTACYSSMNAQLRSGDVSSAKP